MDQFYMIDIDQEPCPSACHKLRGKLIYEVTMNKAAVG